MLNVKTTDINPLSYKSIQNSIKNFRHLKGNDFNLYDEPGTYWFRPVFYFDRGNVDLINTEGLLHPSWVYSNNYGNGDLTSNPQGTEGGNERKEIVKNTFASSAYNYLMRNDEQKRANLLKQFIELLSNIVSCSPWYFQEVAGLDSAVDNSEAFKEGKFVSDTRKQITFALLDDAIDNRIGTLLDLYRSACFSWRDKKEIVPANLRKFDMGIYIFGSMIQNDESDILFSRLAQSGALSAADKLGVGYDPKPEIATITGKVEYTADGTAIEKGQAHMYLEFINCEIDLSSVKGGDTLNNGEGSGRKYSLVINYDDCYVNRYNDFIIGSIGDMLRTDIYIDDEITHDRNYSIYGNSINTNIGRKTDGSVGSKIVGNLEGTTLGKLKETITSTVGNILLGNIYNLSFTNTFTDITSGRAVSNVINSAEGAVKSAIKNVSIYNTPEVTNLGSSIQQTETIEEGKTLYTPTPVKVQRVKQLGNLYKGVSMMSNL